VCVCTRVCMCACACLSCCWSRWCVCCVAQGNGTCFGELGKGGGSSGCCGWGCCSACAPPAKCIYISCCSLHGQLVNAILAELRRAWGGVAGLVACPKLSACWTAAVGGLECLKMDQALLEPSTCASCHPVCVQPACAPSCMHLTTGAGVRDPNPCHPFLCVPLSFSSWRKRRGADLVCLLGCPCVSTALSLCTCGVIACALCLGRVMFQHSPIVHHEHACTCMQLCARMCVHACV